MRVRETANGLSVHAIAGTDVVLFGFDVTPAAAKGLLGFEVERSGGGKKRWLYGGMAFRNGSKPDGAFSDSRTAPIQAFLWGDYEAARGTKYTYTVRAKYGDPGKLETRREVSVSVTTEDPTRGVHGVYFNRGVAGSEAYNRRFREHKSYYLLEKFGRERWTPFIRPDQVPGDDAWKWLSRGLREALLEFIGQADGPRYALRVAAYELDYSPVIAALAAALEGGADVQVVHHSKRVRREEVRRGGKNVVVESLDSVGESARAAIRQVGIRDLGHTQRWQGAFFDRTDTTISHNKFIVLLKDDKPVSVWTGSTNFTAGGIFGQSNVGHVVRDKDVAARYLDYWTKLKTDPPRKKAGSSPDEMGMQAWNISKQPDLKGPPATDSIKTIFSPRPTTDMLQWYADRLGDATSSVHFTAAFGVSQQISRHLAKPSVGGAPESYSRYIMLESLPPKAAAATAGAAAKAGGKPVPVGYSDYKDVPCNRITWGDLLKEEVLSGLNLNVDYLHTKYMLIDPLTDNPTVITGSANFSDNSTTMNDENMLVISGDKRVAEIYLTEFMRLFKHFQHRNKVNAMAAGDVGSARFLAADDSWTKPYFEPGTAEHAERLLFR